MADEKEKKAKAPKAEPVIRKINGHERSAKITVLAEENPKRKGSLSHARFAKYKNGMTLEAALAAGIKAADISYDEDHGFIKVAA